MRDRLAFIEPMMPTLVDKPPASGDWSTEVKFDGWRCQLAIDSGGVRVFTRRGHRLDRQAEDHRRGRGQRDQGEVRDHRRRAGLSARIRHVRFPRPAGGRPVAFRPADLHGLRPAASRRRGSAQQAAGGAPRAARRPDPPRRPHPVLRRLAGTPAELFAAAERMGLEGIVCKRRGSAYRSGASTDWLKVKCFVETELEILGVQRAARQADDGADGRDRHARAMSAPPS